MNDVHTHNHAENDTAAIPCVQIKNRLAILCALSKTKTRSFPTSPAAGFRTGIRAFPAPDPAPPASRSRPPVAGVATRSTFEGVKKKPHQNQAQIWTFTPETRRDQRGRLSGEPLREEPGHRRDISRRKPAVGGKGEEVLRQIAGALQPFRGRRDPSGGHGEIHERPGIAPRDSVTAPGPGELGDRRPYGPNGEAQPPRSGFVRLPDRGDFSRSGEDPLPSRCILPSDLRFPPRELPAPIQHGSRSVRHAPESGRRAVDGFAQPEPRDRGREPVEGGPSEPPLAPEGGVGSQR